MPNKGCNSPSSNIVVRCCKPKITRVCDEHLFGQVSTCTGRNQQPIFSCTNVHLGRHNAHLFTCAVQLSDILKLVVILFCDSQLFFLVFATFWCFQCLGVKSPGLVDTQMLFMPNFILFFLNFYLYFFCLTEKFKKKYKNIIQ